MQPRTPTTPAREAMLAPYLAQFDSPDTVRGFHSRLRIALEILEADSLADLTLLSLATFRGKALKLGWAPGSVTVTFAVLRSFLKWAYLMNETALEPVRVAAVLKSPKGSVITPYGTITGPEIARLFTAAKSRRDRAILSLLLGAGIRAAELVNLDVENVLREPAGASLHVRHGKGAKDRIVPIRGDVLAAVDLYTGYRTSGPLILSADRSVPPGSRLSTVGLRAILAAVAVRAGVTKRLTPHGMRHTYASRALHSGAGIMHIRALLGHASIATTQRYVDHIEMDELRGVLPALKETA